NLHDVFNNLNKNYRNDVDDINDGGNDSNNNGNRRGRYHHVRRDSEGYVVKDLSLEERAMLVEEDNRDSGVNKSRAFDPHHNSDGSTLYSGSEEEEMMDRETRD